MQQLVNDDSSVEGQQEVSGKCSPFWALRDGLCFNQFRFVAARGGGQGIRKWQRYVEECASVVLDDDLVLHLTKRLGQRPVRDEASGGLRVDS